MAAKTLVQLRELVEADLTDAGNATWTTAEIDRAIRRALFRYSEVRPYETISSKDAAASREYDISAYAALRVFRVWWPYDSAEPEYPPQWQPFGVQANRETLLLKSDAIPTAEDDPLRIYYGVAHTLSGLDGAGTSTYIEVHEETLVLGATAFAAMQRARYVVDTVNPSVETPENWRAWGKDRMVMFEAALDRIGEEFERELAQWSQWDVKPGGNPWDVAVTGAQSLGMLRDQVENELRDSGNWQWSTVEIDRALRQALYRYSEVRPYETISSMDAAASREYDISGYAALRVFRVWWPYKSADPEYPPQWQPFALQGNRETLLLKSDTCPTADDDPLRIYYGVAHTLDGLDLAVTSTYVPAHEETLVLGATAFAAMQQSGVMVGELDEVGVEMVKSRQAWGRDRMVMFEAALDRIGQEFERELAQWFRWDVSPSGSRTLAVLRDQVENELRDSGNWQWSTVEIDRALRQALYRYSGVRPYETISSMDAAASREYDISAYSALRVFRVWWPYKSTEPEYPPQWQPFSVQANRETLLLKSDTCPTADDDPLRIYYGVAHTLDGLDSAAASTYFAEDEETLVLGATAFAAMQQSGVMVGELDEVGVERVKSRQAWGKDRMVMFEAALDRIGQEFERELAQWSRWDVSPSGSRTLAVLRDQVENELRDSGNWQWSTVEMDRALRKALYRYSEVRPQEVIASVDAAASREYSLATLTGLVDVQRVWFPYKSTDPAHPPNWVEFELWDDKSVLYLDVADCPAVADDPLRVFYTKLHTINGLDSEAASTYLAEDEEVLILGAVAFAALARSRVVAESEVDSTVVAQVVAWGKSRMREFELELERVGRKVSRHFDSRVVMDVDI